MSMSFESYLKSIAEGGLKLHKSLFIIVQISHRFPYTEFQYFIT